MTKNMGLRSHIPIKRKTPLARGNKWIKRRTPLNKVSAKRKRDQKIYFDKRRWFLAKSENSACPVAAAGLIPDLNGELASHHRASVQIHHVWRRGRYYLDESTWLGVSAEGHFFIERNILIARQRRWLAVSPEEKGAWRSEHGGLPII